MTAAGELRFRVQFQKKVPSPNPDGGTLSGWMAQFERWADIVPQRGGEEVQAQRLAGVQPVLIMVRKDSQTKLIDNGWRAVELIGGVAGKTYGLKIAEDMERKGELITMVAVAGTADAA